MCAVDYVIIIIIFGENGMIDDRVAVGRLQKQMKPDKWKDWVGRHCRSNNEYADGMRL
jgi:hypothetical protein